MRAILPRTCKIVGEKSPLHQQSVGAGFRPTRGGTRRRRNRLG
jgi:hypothetical protein